MREGIYFKSNENHQTNTWKALLIFVCIFHCLGVWWIVEQCWCIFDRNKFRIMRLMREVFSRMHYVLSFGRRHRNSARQNWWGNSRDFLKRKTAINFLSPCSSIFHLFFSSSVSSDVCIEKRESVCSNIFYSSLQYLL